MPQKPIGRRRSWSQTNEAFQSIRNVSLERTIKEVDLPDASPAEVRFHGNYPPARGAEARDEYWQQLRGIVGEALEDHVQGRSSLDKDIARFLANVLGRLSQGEAAPFARPRRVSGGLGNRRKVDAQRQVEAAVEYLVAADLGVVSDRRSRTTVAEAFGVCREQVYRWMRELGTPAQRASRFTERWNELSRRSIAGMVPRMISKAMKIYARDYQRHRAIRRSRR